MNLVRAEGGRLLDLPIVDSSPDAVLFAMPLLHALANAGVRTTVRVENFDGRAMVFVVGNMGLGLVVFSAALHGDFMETNGDGRSIMIQAFHSLTDTEPMKPSVLGRGLRANPTPVELLTETALALQDTALANLVSRELLGERPENLLMEDGSRAVLLSYPGDWGFGFSLSLADHITTEPDGIRLDAPRRVQFVTFGEDGESLATQMAPDMPAALGALLDYLTTVAFILSTPELT